MIVVLDGFALNPGDLDWAGLHALGACTIHDRTPPDQTVARARDAAIVLTNKTVLSRAVIAALPQLRYIGVLATGTNVIDGEAARGRGIPVTNVPAYSTRSVAQLVFAHVLNLAHHVGQHADGVARGDWSRSIDFCYWTSPLIELDGLTLGIVGLGRIGRAVAELARAFGMTVLAFNPSIPGSVPAGVTMTSLDEVFSRSDVVSLHCPLTAQTETLVNGSRLRQMKPGAFLINTGRGPLVDEAALADALNAGRLGGAGLDVLTREPPNPDNPLLGARNCFITPHIAWATQAARRRLMRVAVENVRAFLAGAPVHVVN